jgi:hypothetical protein
MRLYYLIVDKDETANRLFLPALAITAATVEERGDDEQLKLSRVVRPIRSEPLHTLSEARAYILSLPPGTRHQDAWDRAADLLMVAVDSSSDTDIEQATFQIERALLFHRLLAPR